MHKTILEGFPTLGVSEKIELPNIAELLQVPFFSKASIDDAYTYGGDVLRSFIDNAPLKHDKKFYTVRSQMQFIKPGFCPVNRNQWHVDGHDIPVMLSDDRSHILVGSTSNLYTEFLEHPVIAEEDFDVSRLDFDSIINYFESNQDKLGFKPKFIEPDRYYTFTSRHPHRIGIAQKPEFRYFFEIRESDHHAPRRYDASRKFAQTVHTGLNPHQEGFVCIEHSPQWGVIIRDMY